MKSMEAKIETRLDALNRTQGCPGCTKRSDLPKVHLCSLMKDGPFQTLSWPQNRALNQLKHFLPMIDNLHGFLLGEAVLIQNLQKGA